MVEPRPTKIPEWNRLQSNQTEPPESTPSPPKPGSKDTGWAVNDEPPSSYFNWLQNYTGLWFLWLAERILKGSLEHDLTINALTPDATGAGGDLILNAGTAKTSGVGGYVEINGGDGVNGVGGQARLYGGDGNNGFDGGSVYIKAGAGDNNDGGNVLIEGGNSTTSGNGGIASITGGTPTNGDGGGVSVTGRDAVGTGDGGGVAIAAGDGSTNGSGGSVTINGGNGVGQPGGDLNFSAGNSNSNPGDVLISGGVHTGTGNGGTAQFKGGDTLDGIGGDVTVKGGDSTGSNKDPGDVTIKTGDATGSQGGQIHVRVAEAGVAGSDTRSPTPYVDHDGRDILKQITHYRYTQFQDGGTKENERGVIRLVPQSAVPSAPLAGDVWPRSDTDQIAYHNGTRYHNMTPLVYSNSDEARKGMSPPAGIGLGWVLGNYFAFEKADYSGVRKNLPFRYTIPANSLRVGTIIRVRATIDNTPDPGDYLVPCVIFGTPLTGGAPYPLGTPPLTPPNVAIWEDGARNLYIWDHCYIECDIRVRAIGANGRLDYGGTGHYSASTTIGKGHHIVETLGDSTDYDTTQNLDVYPAVRCPASDYDQYAECVKFQVEII